MSYVKGRGGLRITVPMDGEKVQARVAVVVMFVAVIVAFFAFAVILVAVTRAGGL